MSLDFANLDDLNFKMTADWKIFVTFAPRNFYNLYMLMKKFFASIVIAAAAMSMQAGVLADGYYHVKNLASGRYVRVDDNKGGIDWVKNTVDFSSLSLQEVLDQDDSRFNVYVKNVGGDQYDLTVGEAVVSQVLGGVVATITEAEGGYYVYAEDLDQPGICRYLSDVDGEMSAKGKGNQKIWVVEPVASASVNVPAQVNPGHQCFIPLAVTFAYRLIGAVKAFIVKRFNAKGYPVLELWNGAIPANNAVILCADTNADVTLDLIAPSEAEEEIEGNKLQSVSYLASEPMKVTNDMLNRIFVPGTLEDGSFGMINGATYMSQLAAKAPSRAAATDDVAFVLPIGTVYILLDENDPLVVAGDADIAFDGSEAEINVPTAIQSVAAQSEATIYNVAGARVNGKLATGIYVKNGEKFMVR